MDVQDVGAGARWRCKVPVRVPAEQSLIVGVVWRRGNPAPWQGILPGRQGRTASRRVAKARHGGEYRRVSWLLMARCSGGPRGCASAGVRPELVGRAAGSGHGSRLGSRRTGVRKGCRYRTDTGCRGCPGERTGSALPSGPRAADEVSVAGPVDVSTRCAGGRWVGSLVGRRFHHCGAGSVVGVGSLSSRVGGGEAR